MKREFTGRDMTKVMVGGFGIVVAVNLLMATHAVSGFGGVIVENTYVASQKFNEWLGEAERSKALGWTAEIGRGHSGHLEVKTNGVPNGAIVSAELRRPVGERETTALEFARAPGETGTYRSVNPVAPGRWIVRLHIESGGLRWAEERKLR
ncbi:FixH family protein [Erythrobacter rubeus]|uniref:FixH family protein n=1 Tax=Erythrobacter rubeus TaxID=2760803 RepID=A0ABR8KS93_9SPHN|nr:FixH family protein [Erythrobacter rubeus]MBD2841061.1 FixH family protein [Erythrobacter rubeus]